MRATIVDHPDGAGAVGSASQNGEYEIADIKITVSAGLYEYSPFNVNFLGANGTSYEAGGGNALLSGLGDPPFGSGSLSAGQSTEGDVVFDVPTGGGILQLQGTSLDQGTIAQWHAPR